uniref:Ig-like domain-containing protein n=1 Tax=Cyprinus carpio carpio TaxID=630221 RepID=A0A9J7XLR8_CYPCA
RYIHATKCLQSFFSVSSVSLQVTIEAVIGGSVVLPCSAEHDLTLQDTEVHWRDKDSKIVFDIIKGKDTVAEQDPQYKNRAETFPDEYLRGNFSLKLNNLQHTDTGKFSCFTTPSNEQKTIQLIINESTAEKGNKSTEQENQGPKTQSVWMMIFICVFLLLASIVLSVAYFMFKWRNRAQAASEGTVTNF